MDVPEQRHINNIKHTDEFGSGFGVGFGYL